MERKADLPTRNEKLKESLSQIGRTAHEIRDWAHRNLETIKENSKRRIFTQIALGDRDLLNQVLTGEQFTLAVTSKGDIVSIKNTD